MQSVGSDKCEVKIERKYTKRVLARGAKQKSKETRCSCELLAPTKKRVRNSVLEVSIEVS